MAERTIFRTWSSLTDAARSKLLLDYQPVLDCQQPTCSFDAELRRMQDWLAARGISICEEEVRSPKKG